MPWTTTFSDQGAEVRFFGSCDGCEVYDSNREVFMHVYEQGFQYAIVDFSKVEYLDLPTADLLRIAEYDRQYLLRNPTYLLAMIAPQAHIAGLAKTFERFMQGSTLRSVVASSRDEANAWLRAELTESAA